MKTHLIILALCSVVSGSLISVQFLEDFMELYSLKDPMFILHSNELDDFLWEFKPFFLKPLYCLCYETGTSTRKEYLSDKPNPHPI